MSARNTTILLAVGIVAVGIVAGTVLALGMLSLLAEPPPMPRYN